MRVIVWVRLNISTVYPGVWVTMNVLWLHMTIDQMWDELRMR